MAKRPRFSRWRRLPGVFRTGDHRPADSGTDLDRLILYVPTRILDMAESLAEKAGVPTVQDYCALLLMRALENERVQQKVSDIEARHGPLEGLKQIADDPDYLAEWQKRADESGNADLRPDYGDPKQAAAHIDAAHHEGITVEIGSTENPLESRLLSRRRNASYPPHDDVLGDDEEERTHPVRNVPATISMKSLKPAVLKMTDASAIDVISRHTGSSDDEWGFLPCLRRGEAVPAAKSAELVYALNQLEAELAGSDTIDRRAAHGLHRLALESQVLLTDAWPGRFDARMIGVIRTVQEAVERILSGQDIRYYPQAQATGSERPS